MSQTRLILVGNASILPHNGEKNASTQKILKASLPCILRPGHLKTGFTGFSKL